MATALENHAKRKHCQVYDFERDSHGNIISLHTNQGKIGCENIVNATGGWSSDLFASIDIHIPVALEPVYAANFLVSSQDVTESLPIIADFVNRAYFRRCAAVFYTCINQGPEQAMILPAPLAER